MVGPIYRDKKQELSKFSEKLNFILTKLMTQITICRQQIDETQAYRRLTKLFRSPTEIMEVFKGLIYSKDNVQPLIDGSTENPVNIDVLKRKNMLLFFSGLDISDDDISILKPIYDSIRKDDQYKIVWIPIVDQWTEDRKTKFELLRPKMSWYLVKCFSLISGIRFVKEKWNFMGKPSVVVLNPQGRVEHENAIHMIRLWGIKAFPFTSEAEQALWNGMDLIRTIAANVQYPNIDNWIKDQKYIFFYGGKDNEWITQFKNKAAALASDEAIKKERISIEFVCVGKDSNGEDNLGILGRFWTVIESMFFSKGTHRTDADSMKLEIQKLLSYKNESGWALLSKGSN